MRNVLPHRVLGKFNNEAVARQVEDRGAYAAQSRRAYFWALRPPLYILHAGEYSQMKLQMKREALMKLNRQANEPGNGGAGSDTEKCA